MMMPPAAPIEGESCAMPIYCTAWRYLLPVALALIAVSVVWGFFATGGAPAWVFGFGVAIGGAGLGSLVAYAVMRGRARISEEVKSFEETLDRRP